MKNHKDHQQKFKYVTPAREKNQMRGPYQNQSGTNTPLKHTAKTDPRDFNFRRGTAPIDSTKLPYRLESLQRRISKGRVAADGGASDDDRNQRTKPFAEMWTQYMDMERDQKTISPPVEGEQTQFKDPEIDKEGVEQSGYFGEKGAKDRARDLQQQLTLVEYQNYYNSIDYHSEDRQTKMKVQPEIAPTINRTELDLKDEQFGYQKNKFDSSQPRDSFDSKYFISTSKEEPNQNNKAQFKSSSENAFQLLQNQITKDVYSAIIQRIDKSLNYKIDSKIDRQFNGFRIEFTQKLNEVHSKIELERQKQQLELNESMAWQQTNFNLHMEKLKMDLTFNQIKLQQDPLNKFERRVSLLKEQMNNELLLSSKANYFDLTSNKNRNDLATLCSGLEFKERTDYTKYVRPHLLGRNHKTAERYHEKPQIVPQDLKNTIQYDYMTPNQIDQHATLNLNAQKNQAAHQLNQRSSTPEQMQVENKFKFDLENDLQIRFNKANMFQLNQQEQTVGEIDDDLNSQLSSQDDLVKPCKQVELGYVQKSSQNITDLSPQKNQAVPEKQIKENALLLNLQKKLIKNKKQDQGQDNNQDQHQDNNNENDDHGCSGNKNGGGCTGCKEKQEAKRIEELKCSTIKKIEEIVKPLEGQFKAKEMQCVLDKKQTWTRTLGSIRKNMSSTKF